MTLTGRAARWAAAGLVTLAAFAVATWLSGAILLTRLLPAADIRWPVAFGIGTAAAAFAGLWGQSWATQPSGDGGDLAVHTRGGRDGRAQRQTLDQEPQRLGEAGTAPVGTRGPAQASPPAQPAQ